VRSRDSIGALLCIVCVTIPSRAVSNTEPPALPVNISVGPELHDVVAVMLRDSETFRSQTRLLGAMPHVRVRIVLDDHLDKGPFVRARCDLKRYAFGAITAVVHVKSRPDAIELIAHELEHVLEFAEGTNYRIQARERPGSVWKLNDAYETTRAMDAGLRAKRETRLATARVARR
jgi:hypothetical protein